MIINGENISSVSQLLVGHGVAGVGHGVAGVGRGDRDVSVSHVSHCVGRSRSQQK